MKVLYTSEIFNNQKFGGVSRYFVEIIDNLDADVKYSLPVCVSENEYLKEKKIVKIIRSLSDMNFYEKRKILRNINKILFLYKCWRKDFDLVHPTYYDPYFLDHIGEAPFVVTVHDMIHELYPQFFKAGDVTMTTAHKKLLCEKAAKIIAISENTKNDIVEIFNIDPSKIEVVYHGVSFVVSDNFNTLDLPSKYILFTGNRTCYKNFDRFAEAFSKLDKEYHLVCTGSKFSKEENALIDKLSIKDRIHVMYVSDKELVEIYSRAELFVFPSEYEGFGLPILEAFATNCPIALSNASCFPEIAEDAGVYFDPLDVESIFSAMKQVLENDVIKKMLIKNGKKQLAKFSWKRAAEETSAVYKSVIKDK